ncbi:hypothetical protein AB0F92_39485 [Kitasatospora aureofaciens]|uniref:hypothetical protein n=1 Tax=Kitasatospora aureofaciens TaxID=1894 RepID=UPI0033E42F66
MPEAVVQSTRSGSWRPGEGLSSLWLLWLAVRGGRSWVSADRSREDDDHDASAIAFADITVEK